MPTRITACFQALRSRGEKALIPYLTAGDPNLETTFEALQVLDQSGADLIELGVPYSDPLADGPVIQAAATRALSRGVTLGAILQGLRCLSLQAPLILFTYYNPIHQQTPHRTPKFLDRSRTSATFRQPSIQPNFISRDG